MKKIAVLTPVDEKDGIADYSRQLYASLLDDVEIIPLKRRFAAGRGLAARASAKEYFKNLANECNRYELIHIQHEYSFFGQLSSVYNYHWWFFSHLKVPYIITVHEVPPVPVQILRHPKSRLKRLLVWPLNAVLDLVFGAAATERFLNYELMTKAKIVYVHDKSQQETLAQRNITSTWLPFGLVNRRAPLLPIGDQVHLGTFGFITSRKGYDVAVKAMGLLPERYHLSIIGGIQEIDHHANPADKAYLAELKQLISTHSLSNRVTVTGYLPEEKALAAIAQIHLGLAPFKSMSGSASIATMLGFSKLVVASDLPQIRNLIAEGAAVTAFNPDTAEALAKKIEELVATDSIGRLTEQGRSYLESHNYVTIARQLLHQYLLVLD